MDAWCSLKDKPLYRFTIPRVPNIANTYQQRCGHNIDETLAPRSFSFYLCQAKAAYKYHGHPRSKSFVNKDPGSFKFTPVFEIANHSSKVKKTLNITGLFFFPVRGGTAAMTTFNAILSRRKPWNRESRYAIKSWRKKISFVGNSNPYPTNLFRRKQFSKHRNYGCFEINKNNLVYLSCTFA